jgi:hypothetical protein
MTAHLRLRGRPHVEVDGALLGAAIRRKGWALLAVLVLADHRKAAVVGGAVGTRRATVSTRCELNCCAIAPGGAC